MKNQLYNLRKNKKLLQKDVANMCGLTTRTYSSYENSEREPTFDILCKLADFFSVSVDEILGRTSQQQLFDDARVPKSKFQALFDSLTVWQQEIVIERMNAFDDANKETDKKK